jgi:hypothetical protein
LRGWHRAIHDSRSPKSPFVLFESVVVKKPLPNHEGHQEHEEIRPVDSAVTAIGGFAGAAAGRPPSPIFLIQSISMPINGGGGS